LGHLRRAQIAVLQIIDGQPARSLERVGTAQHLGPDRTVQEAGIQMRKAEIGRNSF
jgi:hypothetical protein